MKKIILVSIVFAMLDVCCLRSQQVWAQGLSQAIEQTAPPNNAGLFIGVNVFTADPDIPPLQFAVHDAVEQAHLFVTRLKLIPPKNCFLAVSGKPSSPDVQGHLDELQRLGVQMVEAEKSHLLQNMLKVQAIAMQDDDMVVVSLSSHGFEEDGKAFVMPADGLRKFLSDTAVNLNLFEAELKRSRAGRQILLVDACQEKVSVSAEKAISVRPTSKMGSGFSNALKTASGQARLASCSEGEFSYEHRELRGCGHGVFTAKLIEALEGSAKADGEDVIRMDAVASYVRDEVSEWVNQQNRLSGAALKQQSPSWFGSETAGSFRLAKRMGSADALVSKLTAQQLPRVFDDALRNQLIAKLKSCDQSNADDKDFVTHVADYVDGKISVALFVPYLKHHFEDSPVMVSGPANEKRRSSNESANVETAERNSDAGNVERILMGWHRFHEAKSQFPADIGDKSGTPLLSWRVRILSHLGFADLQKKFRVDESWDSPHNYKLLREMPPVYQTPEKPTEPGFTRIQRPIGRGTAAHSSPNSIQKITDGLANTVACVASEKPVPWTKPTDHRMDLQNPRANFKPHSTVGMYDGSVIRAHDLGGSSDDQRMFAAAFTSAAGDTTAFGGDRNDAPKVKLAYDMSFHVPRVLAHPQASLAREMIASLTLRAINPVALNILSCSRIELPGGLKTSVIALSIPSTIHGADEGIIREFLGQGAREIRSVGDGSPFHLWRSAEGPGALAVHRPRERSIVMFRRSEAVDFLASRDPDGFDKEFLAAEQSFHSELATGFINLKMLKEESIPAEVAFFRPLLHHGVEVDIALVDERGLKLFANVMASNEQDARILADILKGVRAPAAERMSIAMRNSGANSLAERQLKAVVDATASAQVKRHGTDVLVTIDFSRIPAAGAVQPGNTNGVPFFLPARNSVDKSTRVELVVRNQMAFPVELVWIDFDGKRVPYERIDAGRHTVLETGAGHVWLLMSNGKSLAAFEALGRPTEVVVSQNTLSSVARRGRPSDPRPSMSVSPLAGRWKCSCGGTWTLTQNGNRLSGTESGPEGMNKVSGTWTGNQFIFTYVKPSGLTGSGVMNANGARATARIDWSTGATSNPTLLRITGGSSSNGRANMPNPLSCPIAGRWKCSCGGTWNLTANGNQLKGTESDRKGTHSASGTWSGREWVFRYFHSDGNVGEGVFRASDSGNTVTGQIRWGNGTVSRPTLTRIP